ncbi:MAG TPA: PTS IIA-like nitrogen-regulatory protein PtsN [Rhizobiales bacterium]|nr:PTS IIA-like nitrogen-regulatory protein PtsN [Hyphomicrobiales bacterium]
MDLTDLIAPDSIISPLRANSKKQVLQELANKAAELTGLDARDIFETILQRERLGSTGIGHGVAIPHGKLEGIDRIFGIIARLSSPVDFEAVDEEPVSIVFLLLAPENAGADHLKALALVSRLVKDRSILDKISYADDARSIYAILTEPATSNAA